MATKRKQYDEYIAFARTYQPVQIPTFVPVFSSIDEPEEPKTKREEPQNPLEPRNLEEFVGQEQAKEVLKIIVDSANKEKRLIPNILLTGAYGHGKTTLAKLIAKRHKKDVQIIDGSVAGLVIKPSKNKIYIIDEAHNIPASVTDSFNILIDAGELRIIACTTNPGALAAPFRSRFRSIYLEEYQSQDIAKIIERAAKRSSITIAKEAIDQLANRSKCNPRLALAHLDFVREIGVLRKDDDGISLDVVTNALTKLGIDEEGLTNLDRKYLSLLKVDRPVGLQYISSILSLDTDTIQEEVEPYLLRRGLIDRTPRGRLLVDPNYVPPIKIDDDLLEDLLKRSLER